MRKVKIKFSCQEGSIPNDFEVIPNSKYWKGHYYGWCQDVVGLIDYHEIFQRDGQEVISYSGKTYRIERV